MHSSDAEIDPQIRKHKPVHIVIAGGDGEHSCDVQIQVRECTSCDPSGKPKRRGSALLQEHGLRQLGKENGTLT